MKRSIITRSRSRGAAAACCDHGDGGARRLRRRGRPALEGRDSATLSAPAGGAGGASRRTSVRETYRPGEPAKLVVERLRRAGLDGPDLQDGLPCRSTSGAARSRSRLAWRSPGGFRTRVSDPDRQLAERCLLRRAARGRTGGLRPIRARARAGSVSTASPWSCPQTPGPPTTAGRRWRRGRRHLVRDWAVERRHDPAFLDRGVPPHFGHYDLAFLR